LNPEVRKNRWQMADNVSEASDVLLRMRLVAGAFILGTPSYFFCTSHVCMAGHMQHPPYPVWQIVSDGLWMVCFILAAVISVRLKARKQRWFFYGTCFLILSRIAGDLGGVGLFIGLPLQAYLVWLASRYIMSPGRYLAPAVAISHPDGKSAV
jgi:hypothetical protein